MESQHHHHVRHAFSKRINFMMDYGCSDDVDGHRVAGESNPGSEATIAVLAVMRRRNHLRDLFYRV